MTTAAEIEELTRKALAEHEAEVVRLKAILDLLSNGKVQHVERVDSGTSKSAAVLGVFEPNKRLRPKDVLEKVHLLQVQQLWFLF